MACTGVLSRPVWGHLVIRHQRVGHCVVTSQWMGGLLGAGSEQAVGVVIGVWRSMAESVCAELEAFSG